MKSKLLILLACISLIFSTINATIKLPSVISDNMVLQQNRMVTIWGWTTDVNEKITISDSWNNESISTNAVAGRWSVQIKTPGYGGPYTMTIKSHEIKTIHNIMIGEVWLASGQSNMEFPVDSISKGFHGVTNRQLEIANSANPKIRMFTVDKMISDYPQDQCDGAWKESNPENVKAFSATAYFFAKKLYEELGIPIGIICTSWGGTNAESWLKGELTTSNPTLYNEYFKLQNANKTWPVAPGVIYNAMIYPLEKYNIKGAIWYQGESNIKNASVYTEIMTNLITDWRHSWGAEMPFYFTQIAPYTYKNNLSPYLREAQLKTLKVPWTGMAVINDIGDLSTIHPKQKQEVGRRLALWALAKDYNKPVVFSGPLYKSMEINKGKIILHFDYAENGLLMKGKSLTCFEIAGADKVFVPANAVIKGNTVVISAKELKQQPASVRFAFSDTAQPNLFNAEGLPASAFRTDDW